MSLGTKLLATATAKISAYGAAITLTRVTAGTYDPATSAAASATAATTLKALVEDYSLQQAGARTEASLAEVRDRKFTIAGDVAVPETGDKITFGGKTYTVDNVKTTFAGEVAVLHELRGCLQ